MNFTNKVFRIKPTPETLAPLVLQLVLTQCSEDAFWVGCSRIHVLTPLVLQLVLTQCSEDAFWVGGGRIHVLSGS